MGDRTKKVVCLLSYAFLRQSTLLTLVTFAANPALLLSLRRRSCCTALLSFCRASWLLPVALPCLLASLPCIPILHDCCVHSPLLTPPAAITSKTFCHCTPCRKRVVSSTPLLWSILLSFGCAGWLMPNTLPLLLASLPLLHQHQRPCCTGVTNVALASFLSLPLPMPLSIAAVKCHHQHHKPKKGRY